MASGKSAKMFWLGFYFCHIHIYAAYLYLKILPTVKLPWGLHCVCCKRSRCVSSTDWWSLYIQSTLNKSLIYVLTPIIHCTKKKGQLFKRNKRQTSKSPFIQFIDSKSSCSLLHLLDGLLLVFALLLSISARFSLALQDLLAVFVQL